jgi:hypothetical protein
MRQRLARLVDHFDQCPYAVRRALGRQLQRRGWDAPHVRSLVEAPLAHLARREHPFLGVVVAVCVVQDVKVLQPAPRAPNDNEPSERIAPTASYALLPAHTAEQTYKSIAELMYPKPLNQAYFYRPMYPMYPYVPLFLCTPREMGVNAIFFQTVDTISKSPYLFN